MGENHCINGFRELGTCYAVTVNNVNAYCDPFRARVNEMSLGESLLMSSITLAIFFSINFSIYRFPSFTTRDNILTRLPWLLTRKSGRSEAKSHHVCTCPRQGRSMYHSSTHRTLFTDTAVYIYAWPSKGGVIILDADAVDLEFLGLDPLNPPLQRHPNQAQEDEFCQRLLRAGGKWWDSEVRYRLVMSAKDESPIEFEDDTEPTPTMKERRFFKVGWPSTGGVWVAEYDTNLFDVEEEDNIVPFETSKLGMARTMDERCKILRDHFRARFYQDPRDYKGHGDLNSWNEDADRDEKVFM